MVRGKIVIDVAVEPCEPGKTFPLEKVKTAVARAVRNAVKDHEENGFVHEMAGELSIQVLVVMPSDFTEEKADADTGNGS